MSCGISVIGTKTKECMNRFCFHFIFMFLWKAWFLVFFPLPWVTLIYYTRIKGKQDRVPFLILAQSYIGRRLGSKLFFTNVTEQSRKILNHLITITFFLTIFPFLIVSSIIKTLCLGKIYSDSVNLYNHLD